MNQYEEATGRPLEIIVGLITFFIALMFLLLLVMLVSEASVGWPLFLGAIFLGLPCYWFSQLSVRLVLNKRNSNGGLLSIGGIKFWSAVFGCSSCGMIIMGIFLNELGTIASGIGMLVACYYGWGIALRRENSEKT